MSQQAFSQSAFTTRISDHDRGYLVYQTHTSTPNQPLAIILHSNRSFALASFRSDAVWKEVGRPTTIVFPMAINSYWNCDDGTGRDNELLFIKRIIEEAHNNYLIDRNRVFIIAEGGCYCVAVAFKQKYPRMVNSIVRSKEFVQTDQSIIRKTDSLARIKMDSAMYYELWKRPEDMLRDYQKEREDSIKRSRWQGRTTVEVGKGGFKMLGGVKTDIDDKTYMDISDAHQQLDLDIARWMNDSVAWFVNVTWLMVPKKQEVKRTYQGSGILIKGEGGGGAVIPVTAGLKYAFHRKLFRPYFLLGTGLTSVIVVGGKFRTTNMVVDPSAIQDDVESEVRTVMHIMLGSGCAWRPGKRASIGAHLRYIHSSQFESAGQINAVRGFSASVGLAWMFGVNKLN
ncbi:MAG TPA: hypothetical protein VGD26_05820 [Chitinophagaceae bacterium]